MRTIEHRGFLVRSVDNLPNIYEIKFNGTGKVANALQGQFTTPVLAKFRIDQYLEGSLSKKGS